jgi:hypothetical protein
VRRAEFSPEAFFWATNAFNRQNKADSVGVKRISVPDAKLEDAAELMTTGEIG